MPFLCRWSLARPQGVNVRLYELSLLSLPLLSAPPTAGCNYVNSTFLTTPDQLGNFADIEEPPKCCELCRNTPACEVGAHCWAALQRQQGKAGMGTVLRAAQLHALAGVAPAHHFMYCMTHARAPVCASCAAQDREMEKKCRPQRDAVRRRFPCFSCSPCRCGRTAALTKSESMGPGVLHLCSMPMSSPDALRMPS